MQLATSAHCLLSTALVNVTNATGNKCTARLLLDNGSTANFVTQSLSEKLGLSQRGTSTKAKTKWFHSSDEVKLGALVLIKDKTAPPLLWCLGRVVKIYPGVDGVTRVAELKTKMGTFRRAFNCICPLPEH
ncbi:uncharacterized protein LOC131841541 isoform X1 [Achroia grisella]|uniref:uncharacterized protein LOC131841541 isoform X1 n=1 Tax=Achroia grisella TaxID=688607 RepID=UPI0027D2E9E3|nr:uncharacterized protein LOC131841541 isoform X1 [Achroia grisella]